MRPHLTALLLLLVPLAALPAQIRVLCVTTERKTAWVNCFDPVKREILGSLKLDHGSPVWKKDYADLGGFTGQRLRFGSGRYASIEVKIPMRSGGVRVGLGTYHLA